MLKIQSTRRTQMKICDSIKINGVTIPVLAGQCSHCDVISQNGYRYKNGFWDKVVGNELVQDSIENKDMLGMIEHPKDDDAYMKTPYTEASHIILKAWCDSGNPYAQFGILNNEQGNALKALTDIGHKPGVSTRGLGSYGKDTTSEFVDADNYMLITWDITKSPNFADLKMEKVTDSLKSSPIFREAVEMYHLRDSIEEDYNKEKLFADMKLCQETMIKITNNLHLIS